jgi:recombination protein RecA
LDIRRIASIKQGQEVIGNRTRVRVVKNKVSPPFKEAEFDIIYGKGISREGDVLDLAVDHNIIEKTGTWYSYRDQRVGQGRENTKTFLEENPEVFHGIEVEIMERFNLKGRVREEEMKSGAE